MTKRVERREFVRSLGAIPVAALPGLSAVRAVLVTEQTADAAPKAQFVGNGKDRAGTPVAMGFSSLTFKVAGQQSNGGLFLMEHVGIAKGGGPPRHIHHEQDEWFYVVEGELVAEVDGQKFRLKAGDSVFAPRKLPHAFLYVGEKPGRLLIGYTPAGKMEAYFQNGHGFDAATFARYGMQYVGPALTMEEAEKV